MNARILVALVLVAVASSVVSQALASNSPIASTSSLSRQVQGLNRRTALLERRVRFLSYLSQRPIPTVVRQASLEISSSDSSFQSGHVDCLPGDHIVGGGIAISGVLHTATHVIESAPIGDGWAGSVYAPQGDDAQVLAVCAEPPR